MECRQRHHLPDHGVLLAASISESMECQLRQPSPRSRVHHAAAISGKACVISGIHLPKAWRVAARPIFLKAYASSAGSHLPRSMVSLRGSHLRSVEFKQRDFLPHASFVLEAMHSS
ncbi:hypothetical protein OIU85_020830 [Salix viminalis]|uniref:Uncharacterized protein n=1 Tax=Salix viminalis TaxID=40686 RepID=A0A9Q0UH78_SALVM|nr:hypothetical protein OIU85_020830 [Salix viminalis]